MSVFRCLAWTTRLDKILDQVQPGDLVCFHRGLFIHHAVYVGRGRAVHHHLGPSDGEVIEATMEYLAKGDLMKAYEVTDSRFSRSEIVQRARSKIGPLPYSLHGGNCEHFTSWVYHGVRQSKQLNSLCQYQLRLLQVVKHSPNPETASQKQQQQQQMQAQQTSDLAEPESTIDNPSNKPNDDESEGDKDDFVFVPPRPLKYRPAKNSAQLAFNHTRSCLKVLTVQAVVKLAAVPLHKCGLQADNLRRLGRQFKTRKRKEQSGATASQPPEASAGVSYDYPNAEAS